MAQDKQPSQIRIASIVIIGVMAAWMGVSWLGGQLGWPVRYAILGDLAALAALFWALVVLFQAWRKGQRDEG